MKFTAKKLAAAVLTFVMLGADICAFAKPIPTIELPEAIRIIDEEAFSGDTSIEKVVLPDGISEIRSRAFADSSLKEINLPASVETIAANAFDDCGDIGVTAQEGSYAYQWALEKGYIIPPSAAFKMESAHPYAANADHTWEYTHPAAAPALKVRFSRETKLEQDYDFLTVTGSTGVSAQYTGEELSGKTLILPGSSFSLTLKSDEAVQNYGFNIEAIEEASWDEVAAEVFTTRTLENGTLEISGYNGYYVELVIPETIDGKQVTAIGNNVFEDCRMLRKLTLPSGLTSIGANAFYGCYDLQNVILPETLTHLGVNAFSFCVALTEITLPGSITHMEGYTFTGCDKLVKATVCEGIRTIPNNIFESCDKLVSVSLPSTLTSIQSDAFLYCRSLRESLSSRHCNPARPHSHGASTHCPEWIHRCPNCCLW